MRRLANAGSRVALPAVSVPAAEATPPPASEEFATVPVSARDPQWGAHDAPVTIVLFSDFQCPFCSRVQQTLKQIRDTYGPHQVRLVWKNNPLPFHQSARPAAEAGMAVYALKGNEAFWQFHDRAFQNQATLTAENFDEWASEAGVDLGTFHQALAAKTYSGKIDQDIALASIVGAIGTPAFRINGAPLSGAQPFETFKELIDAQLAEAEQARASGTAASDVYATLTNKHQALGAKPDPATRNEQAEDSAVWKVPIEADDPVRGPGDALITIVEFADYQCPFSARVEATLKRVSERYGKDVRVVWKDNPLSFHPRARPAASLARLVYAQKGNLAFWNVHDQLFASRPRLEDEDLKPIAESAGVSWAAGKAALDAPQVRTKIDASINLAKDLEARGTPHFFINGVRLTGAQPFETFSQRIDEQLEKAQALIARGVTRDKVYEESIKGGKEPPPPERKAVPAPDASDPARGNANAQVIIQEFADFQCPFCQRVEPTLRALEKTYGGQIKLVWRHFPKSFHEHSQLAAESAQEVFAQKGAAAFWAFHDKLFSNPDLSARTERSNLERLAREAGVNMTAFEAALDNGKHKSKIAADVAIASRAAINGTPAFVINGYYLSGAQEEAAFKKLIDLALKGGPPPTTPPAATPPPAASAPAPTPPVAATRTRIGAPSTIEASHILIAYQGALRASPDMTRSKEEARKRAEEVLAKLKKGANFAQMAGQYSDEPGATTRGGALGRFERVNMIAPFSDAAFALKVNELSGVVETPFGFHVILRTK